MKHFIIGDYFLYACNWQALPVLLFVVGFFVDSPEMTGIPAQFVGRGLYTSYDATCVAVHCNTHAFSHPDKEEGIGYIRLIME